jgi:hypothetical protein
MNPYIIIVYTVLNITCSGAKFITLNIALIYIKFLPHEPIYYYCLNITLNITCSGGKIYSIKYCIKFTLNFCPMNPYIIIVYVLP